MRPLQRGGEYGQDPDTGQPACPVVHGEYQRVTVDRPAIGEQRHAPQPVEQQRTDQPQQLRPGIEAVYFRALDVEGENHYRGEAAGRTEGRQRGEILGEISAPADRGPIGLAQRIQLTLALDYRQSEKNEHEKSQEPGRQRNRDCGRAGENANRVEYGQRDDVDEGLALERQRVGQRYEQIEKDVKPRRSRQSEGQREACPRQRREHPGRHQVKLDLGPVRRDEGSKYEYVLDPLMRAQGPDIVEGATAESGEKPGILIQRLHFPREALLKD